jgi:hypothetical protein
MKVHRRLWTELIWLKPGTTGRVWLDSYTEFLNWLINYQVIVLKFNENSASLVLLLLLRHSNFFFFQALNFL